MGRHRRRNEIVMLAPQVPVTMIIIITDIKKGTGMVGGKELTIDHDIGPSSSSSDRDDK